MSTYSERLQALFQLEFFGMKLGLENIRALLEYLERPERKFPSIHIAGTNGKGSVAATLAAIYQADGKRTGLYTSPHLVDFRERIRIDGTMISEKDVAEFLERIWTKVEELRATFFEVTTAMAFDHFARHHVDIAIIETGLGGRLDATNVLERPLATVITSIGFDHMAQLGPTLESIASEKGGIFKSGVPAVVNCEEPLRKVFVSAAERVSAPLYFVQEWKVLNEWEDIQPSLNGEHQRENLKTVLATLSILQDPPSLNAIRTGVSKVASLVGLHARLEELSNEELREQKVKLLIDVAHNEPAFERLKEYFLKLEHRPIVVVGLMKDKDIAPILGCISQFASQFIAVQAQTSRALLSTELHKRAEEMGLRSLDGGNAAEGFAKAQQLAKPGDTILITGSHYVIGEFLQNFQQMGSVIPH